MSDRSNVNFGVFKMVLQFANRLHLEELKIETANHHLLEIDDYVAQQNNKLVEIF